MIHVQKFENQKNEKTNYREKIFVKDISNRELLPKAYKELLKLNDKKTTQLIKWAKDLSTHIIKENIQMEKVLNITCH